MAPDALTVVIDQLERLTTGQERLATAQQQTAVLIERISGRMDGIDTRLKTQEGAPANTRSTASLIVFMVSVVISALCGGGSMIISLVNIIAAHWH